MWPTGIIYLVLILFIWPLQGLMAVRFHSFWAPCDVQMRLTYCSVIYGNVTSLVLRLQINIGCSFSSCVYQTRRITFAFIGLCVRIEQNKIHFMLWIRMTLQINHLSTCVDCFDCRLHYMNLLRMDKIRFWLRKKRWSLCDHTQVMHSHLTS